MKGGVEKGTYALTYCSNPAKSYIVEPKGGEINYNLAMKNPEKFYEKVFNQEIKKTKVAENKEQKVKNQEKAHKKAEEKGGPVKRKKAPLEITQKVTKRPFNKIMAKIRAKIQQKLAQRLGLDMGDVILNAL